ncbi:hypothetical protein NDU88_008921 [Pleurodeles waltl]|uniref:Uncharacterized protein n=1 Tax=Pleurodeles waltl TaxID=8319 RepID=A0AAV7QT65_PLEWA|nr:hypothetical protein NDU88_008921 [Pleurodeles waltl]
MRSAIGDTLPQAFTSQVSCNPDICTVLREQHTEKDTGHRPDPRCLTWRATHWQINKTISLFRSSTFTSLHGHGTRIPGAWAAGEHNDQATYNTMERILHEITAVSRIIEGTDSISALTAETKYISSEITGLKSKIWNLEIRLTSVEDRLNMLPDRDQELLCLRSKVIVLEDKSHRDIVHFFGFSKHLAVSDVKRFLRDILLALTGLTFEPPLELQRVHRIGPASQDSMTRPHPIIACFLNHEQVLQILNRAHTHGPTHVTDMKSISLQIFPKKPVTAAGRSYPSASGSVKWILRPIFILFDAKLR